MYLAKLRDVYSSENGNKVADTQTERFNIFLQAEEHFVQFLEHFMQLMWACSIVARALGANTKYRPQQDGQLSLLLALWFQVRRQDSNLRFA